MKPILASLFVLVLGACSVSKQYYLPIDENLRVEGTICGTVPWGRADIPLASNVTLSVSVGPMDGRLSANLQLPIPSGMTIRFPTSEVQFIDPLSEIEYAAPLSMWKVGVYGRAGQDGYFEYLESDALLEGIGRNAALASVDEPYLVNDLFSTTAMSEAPPAEATTLSIAKLELNGIELAPIQVPLYHVKKRGMMICVQ